MALKGVKSSAPYSRRFKFIITARVRRAKDLLKKKKRKAQKSLGWDGGGWIKKSPALQTFVLHSSMTTFKSKQRAYFLILFFFGEGLCVFTRLRDPRVPLKTTSIGFKASLLSDSRIYLRQMFSFERVPSFFFFPCAV